MGHEQETDAKKRGARRLRLPYFPAGVRFSLLLCIPRMHLFGGPLADSGLVIPPPTTV
jgi:hypothetical protein